MPWRKIGIGLAVALAIVALALIFLRIYLHQEYYATITIENQSADQIIDVRVSYWGGGQSFDVIPSNQAREYTINFLDKAAWDVTGRWPDGHEFHFVSRVFEAAAKTQTTLKILPERELASSYQGIFIQGPDEVLQKR